MSYTFVLAALKKLPNVRDWKLVITPEDNIDSTVGIPEPDGVFQKANDNMIDAYSRRYFSDGHMNLESALKRSDSDSGKYLNVFHSMITHPLILDGRTREAQLDMLRKGHTLYMNRNGGWSTSEAYDIVETRVLDKMIFPKEDECAERIIISRYPGCKHYYLSSTVPSRIFDENRYMSQSSAIKAAEEYVPRDRITVKEDTFSYARQGD